MALLVAPLLLAAPVQAADIFTVNSTVDEVDANLGDGICRSASGKCTLRAAVMQASRSATGATINLPAGTYGLSLPAANGEQGGDLNFLPPASGNPEIRVVGAGRTMTTIYSHGDRAVTIHGGRKAYLADLSIVESGRDSTESCNGGGAICNLGFMGLQRASLSFNTTYSTNGGAIYNAGTLVLVESELADNSSWYSRGGAIYNTGFMAIQDSSITGNNAFASGGAIHSEGTLDINRTTIANNYASSVGGYGGGITSGNSDTRIKASTLAFNRADKGHGGGLALYGGSAVFINSTVVGNRTRGDGGGIFSAGNLQAYNTTIAYNDTQIDPAPGVYASGGGIFVHATNGSASLRNSIVAKNYTSNSPAPDDCSGKIFSYGRNLFGNTGGCTITTSSGTWGLLSAGSLGSFGMHGGPTATIPLLAGSNAINAGTLDGGCVSDEGTILTDQRQFIRVVACDLGAFEFGGLSPGPIFGDGFE